MSKILKSVTLGDVKIGGIFRALGKELSLIHISGANTGMYHH